MFFNSIGRFFKAIGRAFVKIFSSKEAQETLRIIFEKILPEAKTIVERIRAIIPDPSKATVQEIIDLYRSFGYVISDIKDDPKAKGNALLNIASELISAALPDKYETPLIHSAIELALSALKADGK